MKKLKIGNKNKGNYNPQNYQPKITSQSDIDRGLSKMFEDMNRPRKERTQQQPLFQQPQQKQIRKPQLSIPIPEPEPEPEEDEPYWSAQEWEKWALDMYQQGAKQLLPQWFVEAIEGAE